MLSYRRVMKVFVVEAKYEDKIIIPEKIIKKLPKNVTLALSIQYIDNAKEIVKQLNTYGIKVNLFKGYHSKYSGQMIGCDMVKDCQGGEAFFYVGDGLFHPYTLIMRSECQAHCYFPYSGEYKLIGEKEVKQIVQRHTAAQFKLVQAKNIGIIATTKYGQNNLKSALELKKFLKEKKKVTVFISDTLDFNELENFPFVEIWINTMCPRISYDDQLKFRKLVLDIRDAIEVLKSEYPEFSFSGKLCAR